MIDLRPDLAAIAAVVPQGARVLDIGCGDGALLAALRTGKGVDGRGIELSAPYGHDSFLLDVPELFRVVDGFLRANA